MQLDRSKFKNEAKKLKRNFKELENLEKILILIKQSKDLISLKESPLSYIYGFEYLKKDLRGFYSFNLEKNQGRFRLICSFDIVNNIAVLEYISLNHYIDFKKYLNQNKERKISL